MTLISRTVQLDPKHYSSNPQVQQWIGPAGMRRSLPTNVVDQPDAINVNAVRSRKVGYDGGQAYGPGVCVDNWVEERRDIGRLGKGQSFPSCESKKRFYTTEYQARNAEACPDSNRRRDHLATSSDNDYRCVFKQSRADYLFYAKPGFGSDTAHDATIPAKRGASWVGIAPQKAYESVAQTASNQERLEFQRPDTLSVLFLSHCVLSSVDPDSCRGSDMCKTNQGGVVQSDPLLKIKTSSRFDDIEATFPKKNCTVSINRSSKNWKTTYAMDFPTDRQ
ncbi:hypothetical protein BSKO_00026 [Bryopsis sp. KO-2023]|nr:hypothetical protein BSKO_00026 [Bryopsis sp. KO-2023]